MESLINPTIKWDNKADISQGRIFNVDNKRRDKLSKKKA